MTDNPSTHEKPLRPNPLAISPAPGEDIETASARTLTGPQVASADAICRFTHDTLGELSLSGLMAVMEQAASRVNSGDMRDVEATLVSQAMALNALFADLIRRAAANLGNGASFEAGEALLKMALRAQSQCRSTLETLATIKSPTVVYAKQANIAQGPQQVNSGQASATRAHESGTVLNGLLEAPHERHLDCGTSRKTASDNLAMETAAVDRAKLN